MVRMDLFSNLKQAPALISGEGISKAMLMELALALLDTGFLLVVLWVFHRSFPKLHAVIAGWRGTTIQPIRIQQVEILSVDRIVGVLTTAVKAVRLIATLVVGPLLAYTITLPLGYFLAGPGARGAFLPQTMPDGFVRDSATPLLLRPRAFIANARDLVTLKAAVTEQAPRYAEIRTPITIITGDADKTVSTNIHSRPLAAVAPNARLTVLPGVGHMVQQAVPDLVIAEIEAMLFSAQKHLFL